MDIYGGLLESMLACCGRIGFRQGPVFTVAMMALGLGVSLNILSVIDILWTLGLLNNPYLRGGGLHPQRYLCAVLCIAFLVNTILARLKFKAGPSNSNFAVSAAAAPAYVLGSAGLFLVTLALP
jgi:uncharacterized membrane protein